MGRASRRRKALARQQQAEGLSNPIDPGQLGSGQLRQRGNGQGLQVATAQFQHYSGPIPHPDILEKYDQLVPGSAATIINRMEKQSDHRMKMEEYALRSEVHRSLAGLAAGVILSLVIVGVGLYATIHGQATAGLGMVGVVLAGVVTSFVVGTVERRKEREKKAAIQVQLVQKSKG